MGAKRDGALAVVALAVFIGAVVATGTTLSVSGLAVGATALLVFELFAAPHAATVRRVWNRQSVQAGSMAVAILLAIAGAVFAPASVLSAGVGVLSAYLLVLAVVVATRSIGDR